MGNMIQQVTGPCNVCGGSGKIAINESNKCVQCNGNCHMLKEKSIQLKCKIA